MATQGTAMRNGTPMRLVSPAPMLVQPQASRQTPAGGSLYSSATPQGLYGASVNTTVNGGTLSGKFIPNTDCYVNRLCKCSSKQLVWVFVCISFSQKYILLIKKCFLPPSPSRRQNSFVILTIAIYFCCVWCG